MGSHDRWQASGLWSSITRTVDLRSGTMAWTCPIGPSTRPQVNQAAIVDNKRLGPVLAYIAEKQNKPDLFHPDAERSTDDPGKQSADAACCHGCIPFGQSQADMVWRIGRPL